MIRRRRSRREKLDDRASAGSGRAEPPPASQAPPPVFRAPALRGVPGAGDGRRPDGSSLAGGTWRSAASDAGSGGQGGWPAAQGKRQSLHLVSGRSALRPRGRRERPAAPSSAGSADPQPGSHVAAEHTWRGSEREAAARTLQLVQAAQHVHQGCSCLPGFVKRLVLLPRLPLRSRGNVFYGARGKFTLLTLLNQSWVSSQWGGGKVPRDGMKEGCPPSDLAGE